MGRRAQPLTQGRLKAAKPVHHSCSDPFTSTTSTTRFLLVIQVAEQLAVPPSYLMLSDEVISGVKMQCFFQVFQLFATVKPLFGLSDMTLRMGVSKYKHDIWEMSYKGAG